mmetsp:Transcript_29082/g.53668  ORF Transcript_29082/g.53668 Transcript_29082/m.53668 type:complete len:133 (-) Transcript_29082:111-509(-)
MGCFLGNIFGELDMCSRSSTDSPIPSCPSLSFRRVLPCSDLIEAGEASVGTAGERKGDFFASDDCGVDPKLPPSVGEHVDESGILPSPLLDELCWEVVGGKGAVFLRRMEQSGLECDGDFLSLTGVGTDAAG